VTSSRHPQSALHGDDQTVVYKVSLPRDLYDQLERYRREQDRRSVGNAIVYIVHEWFQGRGLTAPRLP